jgi:hypothetical protein
MSDLRLFDQQLKAHGLEDVDREVAFDELARIYGFTKPEGMPDCRVMVEAVQSQMEARGARLQVTVRESVDAR